MTQDHEEDARWLSDEELADLQREVDEAPMTDKRRDGPLPPLESDDPQWVAARWREWVAGGRFRGHRNPRAPRGRGSVLREWLPHAAVADVYCRASGREWLILRVALADCHLVARWNVEVLTGGHQSSNIFRLTEAPTFAVECRCGTAHPVSTLALGRAARAGSPGKPRRVGVSTLVSSKPE